MLTTLLVLALAAPPGPATEAAKSRSLRLLDVHRKDAGSYTIYRDPEHKESLTLQKEPVYRWTNPTRNGGQEGDVFVWTYEGRPEAVGCIFSHPVEGHKRAVNHEFHSLSPAVLAPEHPGKEQWQPQAPGVGWKAIDAPEPAGTPAGRRAQLNAIAREFSAESHLGGPPVRLRLLPRPLYRYETKDADGALYAYVTDAGTDPEILLLVEAHKDGDTGKPRWFFSGARFSDWALRLKHKGKEVWTSSRAAIGTFTNDETHRYRFYNDRIIDEVVAPIAGAK